MFKISKVILDTYGPLMRMAEHILNSLVSMLRDVVRLRRPCD